jgi:type I restriction enzyme S subunit
MSEWKEYKLGDLIQFGNGKERPKTEGNIPVFGGNGILGFSDKSNYENETIIIGRVGAYCGSVFYQDKPIWISDNALSAKPKNNYSAKFLYYYLKNLQLNNFAEGSSHPLVTQTLLNSIEVSLTDDVIEQTAIAEVLSSLDDKIDLLHRQNKTLEQLAETLFRQWFVEEAEEGWEEVSLSEFIKVKHGYAISTF